MHIVVIKNETQEERAEMKRWFIDKYGSLNRRRDASLFDSGNLAKLTSWGFFFEEEDAILFKLTWG